MSADSRTTTIARAWAISRADGLVLGFTDHDRALHFAGIGFRPEAGLTAQAVVQGAGLSVDNSEAIGALSDAAISEADLMAGRWDGAELRQWEVDWTDPAQHRLVFRGHLGEVSRAGGAFRAELRGLSEALNQPVGRVFHPRCSAALGDACCKVDLTRPGLSAEARVAEVAAARLVVEGLGLHLDRWFERGAAVMLDGAAKGLRGQVKNDRALPGGRREIELWAAPGIQPEPGDRVRLIAGCDKSAGTCRAKFGNLLNFRGFPHLPREDWLMAPDAPQPRRKRGFDDLDTAPIHAGS
ncbi:DUF2163 domain-containing protein [Paracoccus sediminicola]|uniref:DUF2163 domain-containing protein n=1 Tax=Paracoccus sediminicola TaxID=3017783 RepID=UPI0022F0B50A|nr:DUF2163 domain-containing protein [Paracoccus sediminicola]WBU57540.1 DUF2163 domain-containing protein [Paracoccus sediminicola]